MERPDFFTLKNGEKVKLPFSPKEYQDRVDKLRKTMSENDIEITILTSMHNIAYYTGFIYCSFGRPYGCVVTQNKIITISANIDASQPWRRSHCDNIIYTDWKRDNFFKAINSIIDKKDKPKSIGIENDHITLEIKDKLNSIFENATFKDISKKLLSTNNENWNTIPRTYSEIDTLRAKFEKENQPEKLKILDDINAYVEDLEKYYSSA